MLFVFTAFILKMSQSLLTSPLFLRWRASIPDRNPLSRPIWGTIV